VHQKPPGQAYVAIRLPYPTLGDGTGPWSHPVIRPPTVAASSSQTEQLIRSAAQLSLTPTLMTAIPARHTLCVRHLFLALFRRW
jgi:hypothetical protein